MYICIYIYYIHTHQYINLLAVDCFGSRLSVGIGDDIHVYIDVYMHACMHVCRYVYIYIYIFITYIHLNICTCSYMYMYMYYIHTHRYTYLLAVDCLGGRLSCVTSID